MIWSQNKQNRMDAFHPLFHCTSDAWILFKRRSVRLDGELTSVRISQNSQHALINHAPDVRHLFSGARASF